MCGYLLSSTFIIARSIGKKGIEPKPFVDRVLSEERLNELTLLLSEVIGQEMTATLDLEGEFKNVKIEI